MSRRKYTIIHKNKKGLAMAENIKPVNTVQENMDRQQYMYIQAVQGCQ